MWILASLIVVLLFSGVVLSCVFAVGEALLESHYVAGEEEELSSEATERCPGWALIR